MRRIASLLSVVVLLTSGAAGALAAPPQPLPYRAGDFGTVRDVLPPGTDGAANRDQLLAFLSNGARPTHNDDQLAMYAALTSTPLPLRTADLNRLFKDASFGVRAGEAERAYSPREDVTIVRDRQYGVPRIYGATRAGTMFGAGYSAAEDRLFFLDVLRHLGRAQLAAFAGGSPGNVAMDREQWRAAPYSEADLTAQLDALPRRYGAEGRKLRADLDAYTAGVNAFIDRARVDPLELPGEYAFTGNVAGPQPWKPEDAVAIASLVGATFGNGGGGELEQALLLESFQDRFGARLGRRLWSDWRSADDPEAPTTVRGRRFPYDLPPRTPARGSLALPDRGTLRSAEVARRRAPRAASNALVVSGRLSKSGHPLAVFGPQVGYFSPQILVEQELHGPGIDARGAAFAGVNMYVQLGRGPDYAWSATSAGQDIIDTFALPLCAPGGGRPSIGSAHYLLGGRCRPMELLTRRDAWRPSIADSTPAGAIELRAQRTLRGIVVARGRVGGRPVVYVERRSTYGRELDSARGFAAFNDPGRIRSARDFQRAAAQVDYTFNWFYLDDRETAYFNSGANPRRPRGVDGNLPTSARFGWRGIGTPFAEHPQARDQDVLTSWNNKQAPAYAAANGQTFGPVYRSQSLDAAIAARTRGGRRLDRAGLVSAMAEAATVDLRATQVLPWALRVLGRPRDPRLRRAVAELRARIAEGGHRRARSVGAPYPHAEAIQILDAWWPRWMRAQFGPRLGDRLYRQLVAAIPQDDPPHGRDGEHRGSAFQTGWYGYAQKDLRTLLGAPVRGRYGRVYCGRGSLRRCRGVLERSLRAALAVPASELYADEGCARAGQAGSPSCYDAIRFQALGGITQPPIAWQNRPTYQQVVEMHGHRPR
ncbi:penicillin acylase family protein [Conexibacter stalactiti]|uniref:Penicillin acylase family protein n=1 Tax=Conexibacter stalactiti TaxID=1940611 RepID=A0ABU4HLH0_9ACTN|nr:penicillin acylase family protein [Conexibacter stalactiti]MDW5594145.1 penicillin acylase family protein [Conexibacter stalactiti]MEC5034787.1 penicillin acylase family protein [Conexibacter stalactiti]